MYFWKFFNQKNEENKILQLWKILTFFSYTNSRHLYFNENNQVEKEFKFEKLI